MCRTVIVDVTEITIPRAKLIIPVAVSRNSMIAIPAGGCSSERVEAAYPAGGHHVDVGAHSRLLRLAVRYGTVHATGLLKLILHTEVAVVSCRASSAGMSQVLNTVRRRPRQDEHDSADRQHTTPHPRRLAGTRGARRGRAGEQRGGTQQQAATGGPSIAARRCHGPCDAILRLKGAIYC